MMKKKFMSVFLAFLLVVQIFPLSVMAYPAPSFGAQDAMEKFAAGIPVSVAHRAAWRMGPENSLVSIEAAIDMGIDVVELDVKVTTDNVVVLSHDPNIKRCVVGTGDIERELSWEGLKDLPLKPGQGGSSAYTLTAEDAALLNGLPHYTEHVGKKAEEGGVMPITRLDDAIDLIDKRCMINLDHCFTEKRFVACYTLFRETDMLNHVFFKNSVSAETMNQWYEAAARAWNEIHADQPITAKDVQDSILYVYIAKNANETDMLQSHLDNGDKLVMVEIVIKDDIADSQIRKKMEPWCAEHQVKTFVNTMWSGLCSTRPDNEPTWTRMLNRGYAAIQTDHPSELSCYLQGIIHERKASAPVEAEHFNTYSMDSYGFRVPAGCDSSLNKQVEKMEAGDWTAYENIVFDGGEKMVNLTAQGLYSGGRVQMYLDQRDAAHMIASFEISKMEQPQVMTAELTEKIPAGSHTVYLEVVGRTGVDLITVERFQFLTGADLGDKATIDPVTAVTEPGVAPVLPSTVQARFHNATYGLSVKWESIRPEDYAQEGTFVVLGYVKMLDRYVKAQVTVQSIPQEIPADGLAFWLDATDVVTDDAGNVTGWNVKSGDAVLTPGSGSTPKSCTVGQGKGLCFDGKDDYFDIAMDETNAFWNDKSEFTVLMYTAAEGTTNGVANGREGQYNSVMYFGETADWGSAYFTPSQNEVIFRFGSGIAGDYGTAYARRQNIGGNFTATAMRKKGTEGNTFVDGKLDYSGKCTAASTANISSDGFVARGKNNTYFKGTICEILIYDRALSNSEIIGIQRAMDQKYAEKVTATEKIEISGQVGGQSRCLRR